ncbi:DNA (cytosine-5-)-methyltransferase [Spiroplasma endosymbiont of Aspidapion aeneum]|uniref:DNA (cytosine-5-)-methyltransferase n=1 Tax=Spiroplasma endosymbiont of Aspidapion aeneum TaxID=3066276 RepID=UPI00313F2E97
MKINVLELFSGIGAQRRALEILNKQFKTNFDVIAISEWDIWANIVYNTIHNNKEQNDIIDINEKLEYLNNFTHSFDSKNPAKNLNKLSDNEISDLYWSYKKNNNLGSVTDINEDIIFSKIGNIKIDLLTYSFPCQDLSNAGKNFGMAKSENTRSSLLWQVEKILDILKVTNRLPKYLLLENVINMLSPKHRVDYEKWISNLSEKYGYKTATMKINAKDYGIPQSRNRVFAISTLNKKIDTGFFTNKYTNTIDTKSLFRNIMIESLKNTIFKNTKLDSYLRTNYKNIKFFKEAYNSIPNNTQSRIKMGKENPKLNDNKREYSRTITTKQDRHPNAGVINIGYSLLKDYIDDSKSEYRFLTPRETFLLMGFDDIDIDKIYDECSYIKPDILYRQAGNSIVVNVLIVLFYYIWNLENIE